MAKPTRSIVGRIRSWFALEWVGDDDLFSSKTSEITPSILVGRRPTVDDVAALQSLGVTHIVRAARPVSPSGS